MMEDLDSSAIQIVTSFFVFCFGFFLAAILHKKFEVKLSRAVAIYIWHTITQSIIFLYM